MLFQLDLAGGSPDEMFESFWEGQETDAEGRAFAERLVRGVCEKKIGLDRTIAAAADNWRVERMAVVDRNVLRLAVYELLSADDTPAAVVIDEAIEIAKRFGSEQSGAFINGVLDAVRRRLAHGGA
jgi:N utilization substance protein B